MRDINERLALWRSAFRLLLGANWMLMITAGIADCPTHDPSTSGSVGAQTMIWLIIAFSGLFGAMPFAWRGLRWCQRVLTVCMAIIVLDELAFYFIGICAMHLSVNNLQPLVSLSLSGVALLSMLAVPAFGVTLIVLLAGRRGGA